MEVVDDCLPGSTLTFLNQMEMDTFCDIAYDMGLHEATEEEISHGHVHGPGGHH